MTLKELYEKYGELMIEAEILNGKIAEIKRAIAAELNKLKEKNERDLPNKNP